MLDDLTAEDLENIFAEPYEAVDKLDDDSSNDSNGVKSIEDILYPAKPGVTLGDAQAEMARTIRHEGRATCPCCSKVNARYRRSLNSGQAATLIWLDRATTLEDPFIHVVDHAPRGVLKSSEVSKLRWWGLVQEHPEQGVWGITAKGRAFASGEIRIPQYVVEYQSEPIGYEGPEITINDALEDGFDIDKLLEDSFEKDVSKPGDKKTGWDGEKGAS